MLVPPNEIIGKMYCDMRVSPTVEAPNVFMFLFFVFCLLFLFL